MQENRIISRCGFLKKLFTRIDFEVRCLVILIGFLYFKQYYILHTVIEKHLNENDRLETHTVKRFKTLQMKLNILFFAFP